MHRNIFTPFENQLLYELVKKRINVIDCKETNKITNAKKLQAFAEIAEEFNASKNVTPRSAKQLRQRYLNYKKFAKKKSAVIRKTGGGLPANKKFPDMEERFVKLGVTTAPLKTEYDSDASYLDFISSQECSREQIYDDVLDDCTSEDHPTEESPIIISDVQSVSSNFQATSDESQTTNNLISKSATAIRRKRPQMLELLRRRTTLKTPTTSSSEGSTDILIEEINLRMEIEKKRLERVEIEHNLKIELLNKEYNLKAELIQKEIEVQQKKIDVQNRILEILDDNPKNLTIKF